MSRLIICLALFGLVISCDKPKIDYQNVIDTTSSVDDRFSDTTKILVSQLPVKFDSTDILLYAIGLTDVQERGGLSKISLGSYSSSDMSGGYFQGDMLMGDFINVVFQEKDGTQRKLTNSKMTIRSLTLLRDILEQRGEGYLLYSVSDRDSNLDRNLTHADIEALYISKNDGTEFKKLTKELHEFYDWRSIKGTNKVYFRTLEDQNRDGELSKSDKFHYYFIDFSNQGYSVTEYNPFKIFE